MALLPRYVRVRLAAHAALVGAVRSHQPPFRVRAAPRPGLRVPGDWAVEGGRAERRALGADMSDRPRSFGIGLRADQAEGPGAGARRPRALGRAGPRGSCRPTLSALRAAPSDRFRPDNTFPVSHLLTPLPWTTWRRLSGRLSVRIVERSAALGIDMAVLRSDRHRASWGGRSPGNKANDNIRTSRLPPFLIAIITNRSKGART